MRCVCSRPDSSSPVRQQQLLSMSHSHSPNLQLGEAFDTGAGGFSTSSMSKSAQDREAQLLQLQQQTRRESAKRQHGEGGCSVCKHSTQKVSFTLIQHYK